MGLKKIAEMRAELSKQVDALQQFTNAAKQFVEAHAKISAAYEAAEKLRQTNLTKVEGLPTLGIKEFEEYKKSLVNVYSGWGNRPLPLKPLEEAVARQRQAVTDAVQQRLDKLAASFPKEVKPGMVFKSDVMKTLLEITSEGEESKNPNLSGDKKIWFNYRTENGQTGTLALADVKKCKYFKTQ